MPKLGTFYYMEGDKYSVDLEVWDADDESVII